MATGKEALGNATIFGGSVSPLQVLMQHGAMMEKRRAEQEQLAVKQRDKLIDDLDKHSPDKVWDPFYGEINQMTQQHVRDFTRQALDQGVPIPRIQQELAKRWGDINTEVARANMHKETYMDAKNQLKANADLYKPEAHSALNDVFFDGPYAKKIHDINTDEIAPRVFDNPDLFNKQNVFMKFMKELPERTNKYYTEMWNPLGQQYNIQDTKTKLGIQTDEKGHVIMDPRTGMPKINMTDDVYIQAKQDPFISKILAKEVPDGNIQKEKDYLTAMLGGYDPKEVNNRMQFGFRYKADDEKGDAESSSIVGSGDNALKPYDQIGDDKKIGFDSISFGYNADKETPFSTKQGSAADAIGKFSGLRTNPSTGKKEIEFVSTKPYGAPGEKEIKYVPYDEKTFEQVLNSLPPKKRVELRKLKSDFDKHFENKKEYVLDETKLNQEADSIDKFYNENKDEIGTSQFDNKFNSLLNSLGINEGKGKKTWFWQDNELKIGDKIVPVGDKEQLKSALYDLQKGRYKKESSGIQSPITPEDFNSQWLKLKSGQKLIGPDGKTYIKK